MLVYAKHITPRLQYIVRFFSGELGADDWLLTDEIARFSAADDVKINYSDTEIHTTCLQVVPHGLLNGTTVHPLEIDFTQTENVPVFFRTGGPLQFDIFAASFFLLSRYEEYLPFQPDRYGRFPASESFAYKNGFLKRPLINLWVNMLKEKLQAVFPEVIFKENSFLFLPTYDIDMAWSYKHKGVLRNGVNFLRDLLTFNFSAFKKRLRVLTGKEKDPFDTFGWLNHLHEKYGLKPYYFFLVGTHRNRNDKNISPHHPSMRKLIADHVIRYPVGLHPSWKSNESIRVLQKEKALLASITGTDSNASRQHFLMLRLPQTYRRLIEAGILFDFSMGYADENGFRASVASPFYWYDLEKEAVTDLLIFPFCFMEGTALFYKKTSPQAALTELQQLYAEVKHINGFFSMIWHNASFSNENEWAGWKDTYVAFLEKQRQL